MNVQSLLHTKDTWDCGKNIKPIQVVIWSPGWVSPPLSLKCIHDDFYLLYCADNVVKVDSGIIHAHTVCGQKWMRAADQKHTTTGNTLLLRAALWDADHEVCVTSPKVFTSGGLSLTIHQKCSQPLRSTLFPVNPQFWLSGCVLWDKRWSFPVGVLQLVILSMHFNR